MHRSVQDGQIDVIKFFTPMFGARVRAKDVYTYTMLHRAAKGGHGQAAGYLIEVLQMHPQDRDKVCMGCHGERKMCSIGMSVCCNIGCCDK